LAETITMHMSKLNKPIMWIAFGFDFNLEFE